MAPGIDPGSVRWSIGSAARKPNAHLRQTLGKPAYGSIRDGIRRFICDYIAARPDCDGAQGRSIVPLGGGRGTFKRLKMRWHLPGRGKSGGLRIGLSMNCRERHVVISAIRHRRSDPGAEDFASDFDASEGGASESSPAYG